MYLTLDNDATAPSQDIQRSSQQIDSFNSNQKEGVKIWRRSVPLSILERQYSRLLVIIQRMGWQMCPAEKTVCR